MPLTEDEKRELVDGLIANCDCWAEEDREILNGFADEKLTKLVERNENVANVKPLSEMTAEELQAELDSRKGEEPTENKGEEVTEEKPKAPAMSPEEWLASAPPEVVNTFKYAHSIEQAEKDKLVEKLTANITGADKRIQSDRLQKRSLEDLRNDVALLGSVPQQEPTANEGEEENTWINSVITHVGKEPGDSDPLMLPTINWQEEGQAGSVGIGQDNTAKVTTEEEWLRSAPAPVRSMVENAIQIQNRERKELIDQLTANVTDSESRVRLEDRLNSKSVDELRDLLTLRGGTPEPIKANYSGAAAAPKSTLSDEDKGDVLPLPTMTFEKKQA